MRNKISKRKITEIMSIPDSLTKKWESFELNDVDIEIGNKTLGTISVNEIYNTMKYLLVLCWIKN